MRSVPQPAEGSTSIPRSPTSGSALSSIRAFQRVALVRTSPPSAKLSVLRLSAQGYSNKEIAQRLDVVVKTVEVHKANGMRKLHLNGRIELLQFAVLQGWLHDSYQHDTASVASPLG